MSEAIAVRVPQMNPNDERAIVVRWLVAKGARVRAGQPLVTLETTKTTFDVDAPTFRMNRCPGTRMPQPDRRCPGAA